MGDYVLGNLYIQFNNQHFSKLDYFRVLKQIYSLSNVFLIRDILYCFFNDFRSLIQ